MRPNDAKVVQYDTKVLQKDAKVVQKGAFLTTEDTEIHRSFFGFWPGDAGRSLSYGIVSIQSLDLSLQTSVGGIAADVGIIQGRGFDCGRFLTRFTSFFRQDYRIYGILVT